jgi:glycosyltransferase involved in cell wall biosynthesis
MWAAPDIRNVLADASDGQRGADDLSLPSHLMTASTGSSNPNVSLSTPDSQSVVVSVVIPVRNFGHFIEEAVTSVLSQDVGGIEVIVVDDGSTDDTVERLARITDSRLRTEELACVGVGAARNHGLSLARGRYIAFLDADDRWRPGKLRRQIALLESEPTVGFVFTNFVRFEARIFHQHTQFDLVPDLATVSTRQSRDGNGRVIMDDTFCALAPLSQLPCWTQTMLVRAGLVRDLRFPADMQLSQDLFYVLNVYRSANGAYITDPLVEVRRHARNSYRRADVKLLPDLDALTRTLGTVTAPHHQIVLKQRLGKAWLAAGYHFFWAGRFLAACSAYFHALRYPGVRRQALPRLLASPLAPIFSRLRGRDTAAFPQPKT